MDKGFSKVLKNFSYINVANIKVAYFNVKIVVNYDILDVKVLKVFKVILQSD